MPAMNVGLRIRVERALSDDYLKACRAEDKAVPRVIREFVRECVAKRGAGSHVSLPAAEPLERNR